MTIKIENNGTYLNNASVPVDFIIYNGHNPKDVAYFLHSKSVPAWYDVPQNDESKVYLSVANSYGDADEENPEAGQIYVVFPNKEVLLYTPAEFEANFKMVTE